MTRYFKPVVTLEVLSTEQDVAAMDLADIVHECVRGSFSGNWNSTTCEVSREEMIKLLEAQRSDPSFLVDDYEDDCERGEE